MDIHFLGVHNCETRNTRCPSLLIDGILALDAGGLTSSLSFPDLRSIKALLVTHHHYDHIKDIPGLAMSLALNRASIDIYSSSSVRTALANYFLNEDIYPNFLERPSGNPTIRFTAVEPLQVQQIEGYSALPVALNHLVPAIGWQITSPDGKRVFYSGDTGPDLSGCWRHISPQLLIIELTASDKWQEAMKKSGHLTPSLLKQELTSFKQLRGYLPQVITVHMNPYLETEIKAEITAVADSLDARITLAYEGMHLQI